MSGRLRALCCLFLLTVSTVPGAASAQDNGGAAAPGELTIERATCGGSKAWSCGGGQKLTLRGTGLDGVEAVVFLGRGGRQDDHRAKPVSSTPTSLSVFVPGAAESGPLKLYSITTERVTSDERLTVVAAAKKAGPDDASPAAGGTFPIAGRHDMGQSETNGFGGGRGHQGQDMFAACGTPLVAVRDATVQHIAFQDRAGNYVVLQDAAGRSYAYMHMRGASLVDKGDHVDAGQRVGYVGETGRASGCHLHFELWTAPGWYTGGHAIDPLPQLKLWHKAEPRHR